MTLTIAGLPFEERPLRSLLHLDEDRDAPSRDYAGFGWARGATLWLEDAAGEARRVDDALVLALHTADDAPAIAGDLELELELPERAVSVLASQFLAAWLPRLPASTAIVLVICNPHDAVLPRPPAATAPVFYAHGDVESWRERADDRIVLTATRWQMC